MATEKKKERKKKDVKGVFYIYIGGMLLALLIPLLGFLTAERGGSPKPLGVEEFNRGIDLFKVVMSPRKELHHRVVNDVGVTWAVYFYKPYCGACRRVKPLVEALGNTVNASHALRFASLDCVTHRHVCDRAGVDSYPRILLYRADARSLRNPLDPVERTQVADWHGMLVLTEILAWFKRMQAEGHISSSVEWPEDSVLAEAILQFKALGDSRVEGLSQQQHAHPDGYLVDINSALKLSLIDAVFKGKEPLKAMRLTNIAHWIEVLARCHPEKAMRTQLDSLWSQLSSKSFWTQKDYQTLLQEALPGTSMDIAKDPAAWNWCKTTQPESGRGGYTCGMWLLFHSLLANTDKEHGADTLQTIHLWVKHFFGCRDCAQHFEVMWNEREGEARSGHQDVVLWLWQAHNMVNHRLAQENSDELKPPDRFQWPSESMCPECYNEQARSGTAPGGPITLTTWSAHQWMGGNVFMFLQEVFCHGSDTLPCAQFYDPSEDAMFSSIYKWTAVGLTLFTVSMVGFCFWIATAPDPTTEMIKLKKKERERDEVEGLKKEMNRRVMDEFYKMREEHRAYRKESEEIKKDR